MRHEISFTDDVWDVVIETSGEANLAGFRAAVEELLDNPEFVPGMNILIDHSRLDANRLADAEAAAIADLVSEFDARMGPGLRAIVVPSPHKFRLAQIVQERKDEPMLIRSPIFYSREFAETWLRSAASADEA